VGAPRTLEPVRAIHRSLDILDALAGGERLTIGDVAKRTRMPRTTAYRALQTLAARGFVAWWPEFGVFGLGPRLAEIARRQDPVGLLVDAARPVARRLSTEVKWPVSVTTVDGDTVVVRYSTDYESGLCPVPKGPGTQLKLLDSAAGRLHLALTDATQAHRTGRTATRGTSLPGDGRLSAGEAQRIVRQGYATFVREDRVTMRVSVAAPIGAPGETNVAIVLRFAARAVQKNEARLILVERLLCAAAEISATVAGHEPARTQTRRRQSSRLRRRDEFAALAE
jgi:IclR family mhp operon transcriptional activator